MAETICAGVTHRETEFAEVMAGVRVFGACGPNALGGVASNAQNAIKRTSDVYWLMANAGLCDSEGVTTLASLQVAADKLGLTTVARRNYADPPWDGWSAFFQQFAGVAPFVAQVGFGQQLVDRISGAGENANNLRSHFICVLGRNTGGWSPRANRTLPAGYWVADGCNFAGGNNRNNNFNAADVLQFYPDDVMGNALPTGALVIKGVSKMAWTKQPDGTGKDDQGHVCGAGVMAAIEAASATGSDGLMSETYYDATESFTPLANGDVMRWDGHQVTQDGAHVVAALWEALQAAEAALKTPPADPLAEAALQVMTAQKALFAKLP